jgi:uncharacterized protein (TIGR02145 family)
MKKIFLFIFCGALSCVMMAQQRGFVPVSVSGSSNILYKQSHALIIGMSNYTNGWPSLQGVKNDIQAVQAVLENNGFNVEVQENLSKEQTDKVFSDFITKYGQEAENRLLFYFAGHGHTVKTTFGEVIGYIVPIDAPNPNTNQSGFMSKSMPMSRIEEYAKMAQSKHALFLFDACFSGALFAMSRAIPDVISHNTSLPVRQFITSGSESETVPDKSLFCEQFVSALTTSFADANKDGYLTGTELGMYLQTNVVNYSHNSQHPQYGKIRNPYLDKGDFVFVLHKTEANPQLDLPKENTVKHIVNKEEPSVITDVRDGRQYKTVKIGNQVWLAENLAYKPQSGIYWAYQNDQQNVPKYGYLYNWETAQKVCPAGWHLPSDEEWENLELKFYPSKEIVEKTGWRGPIIGNVLKSTSGWKHNGNGKNQFGFNVLPAGTCVFLSGRFKDLGESACFWTGSQNSDKKAWKRELKYDHSEMERGTEETSRGMSVRCVKD